MLEDGVGLATQQVNEAGDVEPGHQDDHATDRAVSDVVTAEVRRVRREDPRRRERQQRPPDRAGAEEAELLLDVG